jgi:uncharacterized protein with NRDE domain
MCLMAFAWGMHPDGALLLAANRDEYWDRPTDPLACWALPDGTPVCAGRDRLAGGTWLGMNLAGRVAMLTNVRAAQPPSGARSRGDLVTRWLQAQAPVPDVHAFVQHLDPAAYGGFNIVLGDCAQGRWSWLTNRPADVPLGCEPLDLPPGWWGATLAPGVYGLSNAALDTPWPKTVRLKQAMQMALQRLDRSAEAATDALPAWQAGLLDALLDPRHPDAPASDTPGLSSAFVHLPEGRYGTRSTLLVRWPTSVLGAVELDEWTHHPEAVPSTAGLDRWPLAHSRHRRISMSTWGMPTSS